MTANNLRQLREKQGISQLELARLTKIAPSSISALEHHKAYAFPGWRKRLADALGVHETEIFPEGDCKNGNYALGSR